LTGTFWIWLTFSQPLSIMAIPVFFLGISNIIAFLINTVILSETWRP
jgi:C4-dicarboxylate transporter